MEPGGEAAGVIDTERIAIGRNERRGKTEDMNMVGSFFSYSNVEHIATGGKNNEFSGYEQ